MDQPAPGFPRLSYGHLYYAACAGVLIMAAALRFYDLSEASLWLDEAIAANNSRGTLWEVALYTRHRNSSPVLYPYLLWLVQLVESSPFSVRFIPALASTLTVGVLLFVLPSAGVGRTTSFIAGLMAALSPAAIDEARGVREYGVDALVASLLIVGVLVYLREGKNKLPLCAALIAAPTLQYGLALFGVAAIATAVIGLLWTEIKLGGPTDLPGLLHMTRRLARQMLWPCASFVAGCAIALVTLSGQWKGSGWYDPGATPPGYFQGEPYDLLRMVEFASTQTWGMIEHQHRSGGPGRAVVACRHSISIVEEAAVRRDTGDFPGLRHDCGIGGHPERVPSRRSTAEHLPGTRCLSCCRIRPQLGHPRIRKSSCSTLAHGHRHRGRGLRRRILTRPGRSLSRAQPCQAGDRRSEGG